MKVLADTSVWVDHLSGGEAEMVRLLEAERLLVHPFVVGEIACGNLRNRTGVLGGLDELPEIAVASRHEVREAIERRRLSGRGIGYVDCHLLVSVLIAPPATLWTRDKRLQAAAVELEVAYAPRTAH